MSNSLLLSLVPACQKLLRELGVRQLTSIGTIHGIQCFMHGTSALSNNWNTMVPKCGQRNVCPNIKNMQNYVALLHDSRWVKGILHWTPRGGSSGRSSSYGKLQYKIFAAGITSVCGLTSPETPISGSNATPTSLCPAMMLLSRFHLLMTVCFSAIQLKRSHRCEMLWLQNWTIQAKN